MYEYQVTVTERCYRTMTVTLRANSKPFAREIAMSQYEHDEIDFNDAEIEVDEFFVDEVKEVNSET